MSIKSTLCVFCAKSSDLSALKTGFSLARGCRGDARSVQGAPLPLLLAH
jgi:hypothetical protein